MTSANPNPLVSIGMPVYNGEPYLRLALESLLAQDYENFELIISDNASTDETQQICLEYADRDGRIRYYRNSENTDVLSNFNRVLGLASGEYFAWAASDDLWEPSYIRTLAQLLIRDPDGALAFSAFNSIDEYGRELSTFPRVFEIPADDLFQRLKNYLLQDGSLGKANFFYALMRRRWIQEAGGFKIWGKGYWGSDMLVIFHMLCRGKVLLSNELLFHKRVLSTAPPLLPTPRFTFLPAKASQVISSLYSWYEDNAAYAEMIARIDTLSAWEKVKLRTVLWERIAQAYYLQIKVNVVAPCILPTMKRMGLFNRSYND